MAVFSDLSVNEPKILTDLEAIFQSVINLLNTQYGERFFNVPYSASLEDIVFKLATSSDLLFFKTVLESRVRAFEERITDVNVTIRNHYDNNSVLLDLRLSSDLGEIEKTVVFNK